MNKTSLTEILHTLDYWWAEANNPRNDGWVQQGYKDKIAVVLKSLEEKRFTIKFEETKEEMCF
tara:strand:- start:371 stop:559 length:189 start_codon:yes stop_codon:yes gene_type:complete